MWRKILLVEDDDEVCESMRMALEEDGYEVAISSGACAFDTALLIKPDLIVIDICVPGVDGIHVLRRVRATPALEKTPVLVTTPFGTGSATFSLQHGANGVEPKPLNGHSLRSTVRRLLNDNRAA